MSSGTTHAERPDLARVLRYAVNGLVATAVHFAVLTFNLQILHMPSAGIANLVAAVFGITASFLGSRYYVFRSRERSIARQAAMFAGLYASIACLHGVVLFLWTDIAALDYRSGFLLATGLQMVLSYWGNKLLVFIR